MPRHHFRRDPSLLRREGKKSGRSIILVVCEGETEQVYLEALKRKLRINNAHVLIADNTVGSSPKSVVECALKKFDAVKYNFVYCVFDRDTHTSYRIAREKIARLSSRARNPIPVREAVSVPCIELWFLLHHTYSTAAHANYDAICPVLREFIPGYEKADAAIAEALVERVETAIANGTRLFADAQKAAFDNPFTNMHVLAEHMRSLGKS